MIVFDVDVLGAKNLKQYFGDKAMVLFIQPPSMEALEQRLRERATENDDTLHERLTRAKMELEQAGLFDKVLVNDDLDRAKAQAYQWVNNFLNT
ncbi:MAG: hypothetical protein CUN55_18140 [Phototrophicales bacterium]|nr:MAG: hypothetical protein CUN55_18140 [Phototrophicales bacterium]